MSYFPKPPGNAITVNLNLESYATKEDLKNISSIDVTKLNSDLKSLDTKVTTLSTGVQKSVEDYKKRQSCIGLRHPQIE